MNRKYFWVSVLSLVATMSGCGEKKGSSKGASADDFKQPVAEYLAAKGPLCKHLGDFERWPAKVYAANVVRAVANC